MIVLTVLSVVAAVAFQVVNLLTERSSTEQTKLDMFQQAREFMDQMSRDLRQAGYPNTRNMAQSVFTVTPAKNDHHAAAGLVKIADGDLWFEGDVDGSGVVSVIMYHLEPTGNGCPCLKRSQLPKIDGDPLSEQTTPSYQVEVQGVQNTAIFSAYNEGAPQTLPLDITNNGAAIAGLDTVQAVLSLQAPIVDPKTRQKPVTTLVTTVRLNNCSMASTGAQLSCL
jgi:type II secretory pathway pseudopilin PulG